MTDNATSSADALLKLGPRVGIDPSCEDCLGAGTTHSDQFEGWTLLHTCRSSIGPMSLLRWNQLAIGRWMMLPNWLCNVDEAMLT